MLSLSSGADFEHIFELAPVSLWLEDYSALKQLFDHGVLTGFRTYGRILRQAPGACTSAVLPSRS